MALSSCQIKVEYGLLQEVRGEEIGWLPLQAGFGLGSARLKDWDTQVRGEPGRMCGTQTVMIDSRFGAKMTFCCARKVFAVSGGRGMRLVWRRIKFLGSEPQIMDARC